MRALLPASSCSRSARWRWSLGTFSNSPSSRDWASGPIEAPVPEGRGTWAVAYAALYHRVRLRSARQRDLRLALDRFVSGAEALPEGVVVLDANDRIEWANPRAEAHLGLDLKQDIGAPVVNLVRHPAFVQYLSAATFANP